MAMFPTRKDRLIREKEPNKKINVYFYEYTSAYV
jgi:hypothetical protein